MSKLKKLTIVSLASCFKTIGYDLLLRDVEVRERLDAACRLALACITTDPHARPTRLRHALIQTVSSSADTDCELI